MPSNNYKSTNIDLFYSKRGFCPFCKIKTNIVHSKYSDYNPFPSEMDSWWRNEIVWLCEKCNWWEYAFKSNLKAEDIDSNEIEISSAILKKFDIDSKEVPIVSLREYISKNPDKIYNIHHNKMEELVASVFKDHYTCEVHLVGKSHDNGVDLLIIESDSPIVIQVKRRTAPSKTEAVCGIRELLGATLLQDTRKCMFVTTASKFSKNAIKSKDDAIKKSIVDSFELIDYNKFISLLELNKNDKINYWQALLKKDSDLIN